MSVTDDIKSRIDIVSYVQRFVPALKKAGRNHKAPCPFHNEKTPSFVVNPERQSWRCFGACAEGGDLFSFAQKIHGWEFKEALRELGAEAGVEIRRQTPEQKVQSDRLDGLRGLLANAAEFYQRELYKRGSESVLAYVRLQRGLSDETIRSFLLGYAPDSWDFMLRALRELGHSDDEIIAVGLALRSESGRVYDRFRNRLLIPIRDERGRVVGFGGRALDPEDNVKYINSPQSALFDKSHLLFGLDRGKRAIRDSGTAVIVEGYMDVIQAHQAGHLNVVAQMGTAMTEPQLRLVAPRYAKRIVLALDADEAGQNATRRSLEVARQALTSDLSGKLAVEIRILEIPGSKDPDDYLRESPAGWDALVEGARGVADFVIDMETADLPPHASSQVRQALAQDVLPILLASEDSIFRQENIQKLARRLRIGERELLSWVQDQLPASRPITRTAQDLAPQADLPPEYWDNEYEPVPPDLEGGDEASAGEPAGRPAKIPVKRVAEAYCLSLLLKNPRLLSKVNRKLRELAGDDDALQRGPLCDLGEDDFTGSVYRVLMTHLRESMRQDDLEPLEYVNKVVTEELRADYDVLLVDDFEALADSIGNKYEVDLNDVFKRRLYRARLVFSLEDEMINRALQLRLDRLENERVELQYLQEELGESREDDSQYLLQLNMKIMLSMRAKARINLAVSQKALPLLQTSVQ